MELVSKRSPFVLSYYGILLIILLIIGCLFFGFSLVYGCGVSRGLGESSFYCSSLLPTISRIFLPSLFIIEFFKTNFGESIPLGVSIIIAIILQTIYIYFLIILLVWVFRKFKSN